MQIPSFSAVGLVIKKRRDDRFSYCATKLKKSGREFQLVREACGNPNTRLQMYLLFSRAYEFTV